MPRTASIGIRVEPELKELVKKAAEDNRRTVASMIEKILVEYLTEKGYLEKPE